MNASFIFAVEIRSWSELLNRYQWHADARNRTDGRSQWIFRGQSSSEWPLKTTLERAAEELRQLCQPARAQGTDEDCPRTFLPNAETVEVERFLTRKFQRECHRYQLTSVPQQTNILGWLSWMQHFGAPTRLLDCSYSMFVATFFAIEAAGCGPSAVWAISDVALRSGLEAAIREQDTAGEWRRYRRDRALTEERTFRDLFMATKALKLVGSINPFELNERQVLQQGVFLCPGDVASPFMENLQHVVDRCDKQPHPLVIEYRISDDPAVRREILRHLLRMNISHATLFPDIGGFARSLRQWLAFSEIIQQGQEQAHEPELPQQMGAEVPRRDISDSDTRDQ